jgi:hypothetical protein
LIYQIEVETHFYSMAELTALGTVKTIKMLQWIIRSQVLTGRSLFPITDAVHRLDVGGPFLREKRLKV